jgi:hypothetical protein
MDESEFEAHYGHLDDDELLRLWADRNTLVTGATIALENELQRRGLNKHKATQVKERLAVLAARQVKGSLASQIAAVDYERSMRHFVGWEEPKFYSPYGSRDIRTTFASIRHRYGVWKTFRNHTGHWPVFSVWFHFLSYAVILGLALAGFSWVARTHQSGWNFVAAIVCVLALLGARELGARLMRKLDWRRCSK